MKNISYLILFFLLFASCKKTKLKGDLSFFIGTWEWKYTVKTVDLCEPFPYDSLITQTPTSEGYTCSLVFEKKGKLIVNKNGKKDTKYRLVYMKTEDAGDRKIYYFKLNNKSAWGVTIYNNRPLTLTTTKFPFGIERVEGCEDTHSIFVKTD